MPSLVSRLLASPGSSNTTEAAFGNRFMAEGAAGDAESVRAEACESISVLGRVSELVVELDQHGQIHFTNTAVCQFFSGIDWSTVSIDQLFPLQEAALPTAPVDNQPQGAQTWLAAIEQRWRQQGSFPLDAVTADGCRVAMDLLALESFADSDNHRRCVLLLREQAVATSLRRQLARQQSVLKIVQRHNSDGVIVIDSLGGIESMNSAAQGVFGLSSRTAKSVVLDELFILSDEPGGQPLPSLYRQALSSGRVQQAPSAYLLRSGSDALAVSASATPLRDEFGEIDGCVLLFRDLSVADREPSSLSWQSNHDQLTQLPNRHYFERELSQAVTSAREGQGFHSLIYIDICQFKIVNDMGGSAAGDELLRRLGQLFSRELRSQDLVARLGSDEFGVLLRNSTLAGAQRVADTLLQACQQFRFQWQDQQFRVSINIGAAMIDREVSSDVQPLVCAEAACATAKEAGRNRLHFYLPQHKQALVQRRQDIHCLTRISEALAENRLVLYRQPIVGLAADLPVAHYEILVRMLTPEGQLIAPGDFIPAAERYGLMTEIDRCVLTQLLEFQARTQRQGLPLEQYAVNLSGQSLASSDFLAYAEQAFSATGVPASSVLFEITETAAVSSFQRAKQFMQVFRDKGSRFYLDDFGSGLSSFGYLRELPVDALKIDGVFVKAMVRGNVDYAMVSSINHLAHTMGIETVAEYVEGSECLALLREIGVDYAQGYGIAAPTPLQS